MRTWDLRGHKSISFWRTLLTKVSTFKYRTFTIISRDLKVDWPLFVATYNRMRLTLESDLQSWKYGRILIYRIYHALVCILWLFVVPNLRCAHSEGTWMNSWQTKGFDSTTLHSTIKPSIWPSKRPWCRTKTNEIILFFMFVVCSQ